jgi:integrase
MSRRRTVGGPPRQSPYKRTYADGRVVWIARAVDLQGRQRYVKPRWNGGKSTFASKRDAQRAIDEELALIYGRGGAEAQTIETYLASWLDLHPRSQRTNESHANRISYVLGVEIDGRPLRDWEFDELRRRHVLALVDHMFRVEGRAAGGARGTLASLSAMAEDAIGDDAAESNPFKGIRLRRSDPRIRKPPRLRRVFSLEQIREFAQGGKPEVRAGTRRPAKEYGSSRGAWKESRRFFYSARDYEALLLTPGLTGLRLGEFLALRREDFDGSTLHLRHSAHQGRLVESNQHKNHERSVPVPPSLAEMLEEELASHDNEMIFPTPSGRIWVERNFYRDVWTPAQIATGLDPTPHEFRHSYISHLRAAGIDDADLAAVAGHQVQTMLSVYTHPLERSNDAIRRAIG